MSGGNDFLIFGCAREEDFEKIRTLYKEAIGTAGCTWDEQYPDENCTRNDWERRDLFCLKTEEGEVIGAISVDADEVVKKLPCWREELQPGAELARLVVKKSYQNRGIARLLLQNGMEVLRKRGYRSVHFLVSKTNEKALRSYAAFNFENRGEWFGYDHAWWCYEKGLQTGENE